MAADGDSRFDVEMQLACAGANVPTQAEVRQFIALVADEAGGDARGEVSVRIVDEAEMAEINRRYRGKNQPTNVLAFPAELQSLPGLPEENAGLLGDLVICAPVVDREANEQGKSAAAHWAHMLVHGMLHLLGYDHESDADAREMEGLEIATLARHGIENPYKIKRLT